MKRKLFTQITNEWRDNIWMIIELAIVTGAIWILIVLCWGIAKGKFQPKGFDIDDVYAANIEFVTSDSPEFQPPVNSDQYDYYGARKALLTKIRNHPLVEKAGLSQNAFPYFLNYNGNELTIDGSDDSIHYYGNVRMMSPDLVHVFRLKSLTGKTSDQLEKILREGKILVSSNKDYSNKNRDPKDLIGKHVSTTYGESSYTVGDLIVHIRRNEYEHIFGGTMVLPLIEDSVWCKDLAIRAKPGKGSEFMEAFRTDPDLRRYGNVYLTDMQSFSDIRHNKQRTYTTQLNAFIILILFLLVVVFLGLLGTFWFRMQQRKGEVAIRIVCGATRAQIFRRVISEGLILLLFGSMLISAVLWPFYKKLQTPLNWETILICELVAIALVALGVIVSLWWPARKIMNIEPASAIKEE